MVVAEDAQLFQHVAREERATVIERWQQTQDPQVAVELVADRVDDLHEIGEAFHGVVLRLDGDDHGIRGDQPVHGQEAKVRRAVDQRVVVAALEVASESVAQHLLAAQRREEFSFRHRQVDVRRCDVDPRRLRRNDDLVDRRAAIREDVCHGLVNRVEVDAQPGSEIRLRVHVDAQHAEPLFRERAGQIDGRRCLPDAALLIRDGDHIRHGRHLGPTTDGATNRSFALAMGAHATPGQWGVAQRYPHQSGVVHRFCGNVDLRRQAMRQH